MRLHLVVMGCHSVSRNNLPSVSFLLSFCSHSLIFLPSPPSHLSLLFHHVTAHNSTVCCCEKLHSTWYNLQLQYFVLDIALFWIMGWPIHLKCYGYFSQCLCGFFWMSKSRASYHTGTQWWAAVYCTIAPLRSRGGQDAYVTQTACGLCGQQHCLIMHSK